MHPHRFNLMMNRHVFAPDGSGTGGTTTTTETNNEGGGEGGGNSGEDDDEEVTPEGEVINRKNKNARAVTAYEIKLRNEAAKLRKEKQALADDAKAARDATAEQVKAAKDQTTKEVNEKFARKALREEATKAGVIDLEDLLKLADMGKVQVDENGDVKGADTLIAEMKEKKPHLFKVNSGTSSTEPPPKVNVANNQKPAMEMDETDYRAARKKIR